MPTIQSAIDASANGDEIIVAPGAYFENLIFNGKLVTVRSSDPASPEIVAATIINGSAAGPVVTFDFGESSAAVLDGFTITNGASFGGGAGIRVVGASPTIRRNVIAGNSATGRGGGIDVSGVTAQPHIAGNTIENNSATTTGGGVACTSGAMLLGGNQIRGNTAGQGAGVYLNAGAPRVLNNVISGNTAATNGGGIFLTSAPAALVRNNTIADNVCTSGAGAGGVRSQGAAAGPLRNCVVWNNGDDLSGITATFCNVQDGDAGAGNISADPRFLAVGNYRLASNSPCIDAGDPSTSLEPGETDLDGQSRLLGGRVDIGADEVNLNGVPLSVAASPEENVRIFVSPSDNSGNGSGDTPFSRIYDANRVVNLTVSPVDRRFFVRWTVDGVNGPVAEPTIAVTCNVSHTVIAKFVAGGTMLVDAGGAGDFAAIQPAIDAAGPGDVIVVRPGVYNERIDFLGKAITLRSLDPDDPAVVDATVIDGQAGGHVVTFHNAETASTQLQGFTIRNGLASGSANCDSDNLQNPAIVPCGGGIYIYTTDSASNPTFTSPTIRNCNIRANHANSRGGGVFLKLSSTHLVGCRIEENTAAAAGAGVSTGSVSGATQYNPVIEANRILRNRTLNPGQGGGVYLSGNASMVVRSNVVAQNNAGVGTNRGGGIYTQASAVNLRYNTVADNIGGGIHRASGNVTLTSSIIWGNGTDLSNFAGNSVVFSNVQSNPPSGQGNFSQDPRFADAPAGVYNIRPESACVDAGQTGILILPTEIDIDGDRRVAGARVDVGADEFAAIPGTFVLWVTSTPTFGASITVDPADVNALAEGVTPFFRSYSTDPEPRIVTLTAPATTPVGVFRRWVLDGNDRPIGQAQLSLLMNETHTARAVYLPTLEVSSNVAGVGVVVTPTDINGDSDGVVPFTRIFDSGTLVQLTAPAAAGGFSFRRWQLDGVNQPEGLEMSVNLAAARRAAAVYDRPPRVLTISSARSAFIQIDTPDLDGNASGTVPPAFTRRYPEGVTVRLIAPSSSCVSAFEGWEVDGTAGAPGAREIAITLDTDRAVSARFTEDPNDCNANGVGDLCDIGFGTSQDRDGNNVPDECDPDCNLNQIPDVLDIGSGVSVDCDGNGVPDECEPDCNSNGIVDACDIRDGSNRDCNGNHVPDECEVDTDGDGWIDACDLCPTVADPEQRDVDFDGLGDVCEPGPEIECPASIVVDAPSALGAVVVFPDPAASGGVPPYSFTRSHASGAEFPVGETTVLTAVTDSRGLAADCEFRVLVIPPPVPPGTDGPPDTPPTDPARAPEVTCPEGPVVSTKADSARVDFDAPLVIGGTQPVTIDIDRPSGSEFPIGETTVSVTVTDTDGRTASCSFVVTVIGPEIDRDAIRVGVSIFYGVPICGLVPFAAMLAGFGAYVVNRRSSRSRL